MHAYQMSSVANMSGALYAGGSQWIKPQVRQSPAVRLLLDRNTRRYLEIKQAAF
jgi:hypothetical protein